MVLAGDNTPFKPHTGGGGRLPGSSQFGAALRRAAKNTENTEAELVLFCRSVDDPT